MNVPLLDLKAQYLTIKGDVDAAIAEVMDSQHFILGPIVERCEKAIAGYCGCSHAIGVSSGSDALLACLMAEDIGPGEVLLAWAFDPQKKIPRNGSRLNMVLLMRFDPATLADAEREMAPGGVVAYSAVCTHQQCWVTDWLKSAQVLQCPCHQSRYDLRQGAKVVGGPAPRPLPALPLTLSDGALKVAGPFTDRVGGEKPGAA